MKFTVRVGSCVLQRNTIYLDFGKHGVKSENLRPLPARVGFCALFYSQNQRLNIHCKGLNDIKRAIRVAECQPVVAVKKYNLHVRILRGNSTARSRLHLRLIE